MERPSEKQLPGMVAALLSDLDPPEQAQQRQRLGNVSYEAVVSGQSDLLSGLFCRWVSDEWVAVQWSHRLQGQSAVVGQPCLLRTDARSAFIKEATPPKDQVASELIEQTCQWLDRSGVVMSQLVLEEARPTHVDLWEQFGFGHLVDLVYVVSDLSRSGQRAGDDLGEEAGPAESAWDFELVAPQDQVNRWCSILDATYAGTLDCPELNGRRSTRDTLIGYRETATFLSDGWWIVRQPAVANLSPATDAACVIMAEHPESELVELIYLGVAPEFRKRGLGKQILKEIQSFCNHRLQTVSDRNPHLLYRLSVVCKW